jgi:hypothetical protein
MPSAIPRFVAVLFGVALCSAPLLPASSREEPSLQDVLRRAGEAVVRYSENVAVLLADERCEQKAFAATYEMGGAAYGFRGAAMQRIDPKGKRTWDAEYALVRTPTMAEAGYPWMDFRDVTRVDGKALSDRDGRLSKLLVGEGEWTLERAREIVNDGARFNIGTVERSVNTPGVPLLVLHPLNQRRFVYSKAGEEPVDKVRAWKIAYAEQAMPRLVGGTGGGCGLTGVAWVEPASGDVLRVVLECGDPTTTLSRITVSYRLDARLGLRLPAEMLERPESNEGKRWVEGKCTYANYRRFETGARLILK